MLIYEQLLDLATRIKKVIEDNPDEKIGINMGLIENVDMDRLRGFVNRVERSDKNVNGYLFKTRNENKI